MREKSIEAYDLPERVARFDADMAIMHPNRAKMAEIIVDFLAEGPHPEIAIDLGAGTGFLTREFLKRFPGARVIAVDGAESMVALARTRLGPLGDRVTFQVGDFRELPRLLRPQTVDAIVSSFALHHLDPSEKRDVLKAAAGFLRPGRWLLNADLVIAEAPEVENAIQSIRVSGIVRRAGGSDPRFKDAGFTRRFLDDLERNDGDQPLRLYHDLGILKEAGFRTPSVLWQEHREVVYGGMKI